MKAFVTVLSKLHVSGFSKKGSKSGKCPFNERESEILKNIGTASQSGPKTKSCPIFYTGPPTKKSVCEQRRIKKCLKDQEKYECKVDESKCKCLAPDCSVMPDKEIPGRGGVKNIPGAPMIGWERITKRVAKKSSSSHHKK